VRQSNLCAEIMLHTGKDHLDNDRTAVCCLSSLNAEKFLEWKDDERFIEDVMRFLDNVLEDFIARAPSEMDNAKYSAFRERSVGMGIMGLHSFFQNMGIPFESAMAKSWNNRMFQHIRKGADAASVKLAQERGPCPDAAESGVMARFSHKLAIAPTASISIIAGGTSAGIEPIPANIYTHKTLSGSFSVKNKALQRLLAEKGLDDVPTWTSILEHEGSVQHLECLDDHEKAVFKTAFELDQRWIIELAADRTPYICQGQSLNLFIPGEVDKWDLHMLHWTAWERGIKSLYYCRSKSVQRAAIAGKDGYEKIDNPNAVDMKSAAKTDYDECLACQ
jgi:ribonucleoside-diphosphate reductase alpha chain